MQKYKIGDLDTRKTIAADCNSPPEILEELSLDENRNPNFLVGAKHLGINMHLFSRKMKIQMLCPRERNNLLDVIGKIYLKKICINQT